MFIISDTCPCSTVNRRLLIAAMTYHTLFLRWSNSKSDPWTLGWTQHHSKTHRDSWIYDWISLPIAGWSFSKHPIHCSWSRWQRRLSHELYCAKQVVEMGQVDSDGWWEKNVRSLLSDCLVLLRAKRRKRCRTKDNRLLVTVAFFDSNWSQPLYKETNEQRKRGKEREREKRKNPNLFTPPPFTPQQKLQIETYISFVPLGRLHKTLLSRSLSTRILTRIFLCFFARHAWWSRWLHFVEIYRFYSRYMLVIHIDWLRSATYCCCCCCSCRIGFWV